MEAMTAEDAVPIEQAGPALEGDDDADRLEAGAVAVALTVAVTVGTGGSIPIVARFSLR